jgi:hypothetical protein
MKVEKQRFDEVLKRLIKSEPETAKTIAKPKPKKAPDPKPER